MKHILIFSAAAVLGSGLRYAIMLVVDSRHFPWGTLSVNILGSLLMGLCLVLFEKGVLDPELRLSVMTALLGAFTTFSTFSLDAFHMIEEGAWLPALAYIFGSVILCIVALGATVWAARSLL